MSPRRSRRARLSVTFSPRCESCLVLMAQWAVGVGGPSGGVEDDGKASPASSLDVRDVVLSFYNGPPGILTVWGGGGAHSKSEVGSRRQSRRIDEQAHMCRPAARLSFSPLRFPCALSCPFKGCSLTDWLLISGMTTLRRRLRTPRTGMSRRSLSSERIDDSVSPTSS